MSQKIIPNVRLVCSRQRGNRNHHLFDNNGTWWIQITVHNGPFSERVRQSLKTRDVSVARRRRDAILARLSMNLQAA
jgi:hypothetical protein